MSALLRLKKSMTRGPTTPARRARIASTTSSSIRVKPAWWRRRASGAQVIDFQDRVEHAEHQGADQQAEQDRAGRRQQRDRAAQRGVDLLLQDVAGFDQDVGQPV